MCYRLERFNPEDWEKFKVIRLEALEMEPAVFSPSTVESLRTENEWRAVLCDVDKAVFGLYFIDELIGLTGLFKDRGSFGGETALCVMSYIRKEHRGKGLSRMFYETRIKAAKAMGCSKFKTGHRASNKSSQMANQRFGFVMTENKSHIWPDGSSEDILEYELKL
jgi:GNAT superfamily N-acetyltransferase